MIDWKPICDIVVDDEKATSINFAAILLNHCFDSPAIGFLSRKTLTPRLEKFLRIWNHAKIRHCVDGGSNYLHDLQIRYAEYLIKDPEVISGDFDSVRPEVIELYRSLSSEYRPRIVSTPDQDETDFTKAIKVLSQPEPLEESLPDRKSLLEQNDVKALVVFYTSSGRLDHVLSIYNTLYRFTDQMTAGSLPPIVTFDLGGSVSFLLTVGVHCLPIVKASKWCSLVPLAGPSTITTTGFRWNLTHQTLEFGKFISTSQEFDPASSEATVEVFDKPLLFSFQY